ncbi:MAG: serine/threonine-protein kinase [Crocosphaera sp.]|nr:serine/threonine-protein kinase [Crocosphaera sp.]
MNNQRYEIIRILNQHQVANRVTYLANDSQVDEQVIIKEFKFLNTVKWQKIKEYEKEINVLKSLNHTYISRYLDSFETEKSLCLVQQYIPADSLAISRSFQPEDIRKIALNILDILIYLQQQHPPITHGDIKPENILIDEDLNTYLIDFGLSCFANQERSKSSVAAGTFGFMAPEQIYNKTLSKATDLYGLGVTLICLLTGTNSTHIDHLINEENILTYQDKLPAINSAFIYWLEKLVKINYQERYPSAKLAYNALKIINIDYRKEVLLRSLPLIIQGNKINEPILKILKTKQLIPRKVKTGIWEFIPHPNDPYLGVDSHPWLKIMPSQFQRERSRITLNIDTQQLMTNSVYERQISLHTYEDEEVNYILPLKIFTASLTKIKVQQVFLWLLFPWLINILITLKLTSQQDWLTGLSTVYLFIISAFSGLKITWRNLHLGLLSTALPLALLGFLGVYLNMINSAVVLQMQLASLITNLLQVLITIAIGLFLGGLLQRFMKSKRKNNQTIWQSFRKTFALSYLLSSLALVSISGISFALIFTIASWQPLMILIFLSTSLLLAWITYQNPVKYYQWLKNYQKKQQQGNLILP